jgi:nifR3 family TIM-barrel protein
MREPDKMVEITRRIVEAVKLPVTVKTRLGWDETSLIIPELAERLQDAGVAAIAIHGRTRSQMYRGQADWTLIGEVKRNPRMKIPIIGNGDVSEPETAAEMFDRYGVDGVMIGRATFGRPWIFREIRHYLNTGESLPDPTVDERVDIARIHFLKSVEVKGERVGLLEIRRHFASYFKGIPDFKAVRLKLLTENDPAEVLKLLDYIKEVFGE